MNPKDRAPGFRVLATSGLLFLVSVELLVARNVDIWSSLAITSLVGLQVFGGAAVFVSTRITSAYSFSNLVGIGGAIGFALSGFIAVIAHNHKWFSVIWIPLALLFALAQRLRSEQQFFRDFDHSTFNDLFALTLFAILFLARDTPPFFIVALLIILGAFLFRKRRFSTFARIVFVGISVAMVITSRMFHELVSPNQPVLFPLYKGTDDFIFSEQMSHSLVTWGINENSAALGEVVRYHWLSLGWTGQLAWATHSPSWVATLHAMPVFGSLVIGSLILGASRRLVRQKNFAIVGPYALLLISSPFSRLDFLPVLNTTNLIPYVWLFGLVYLVFEYLENSNPRYLAFVMLMAFALTLGKAPYAAVFSVGLASAWVRSAVQRGEIFHRLTLLCAAIAPTMFVTYLAFIRGETYGSAFSFNFKEFRTLFPHPLEAGSASTLGLIASLLAILGLLAIHVFAPVRILKPIRIHGVLKTFSLGSLAGGLASFVLNGTGSTSYFLSASFAISVLAIPVTLEELFKRYEVQLLKVAFIAVAAGLVWGAVNFAFDRFINMGSATISANAGLSFQGILIIVLVGVVATYQRLRPSKIRWPILSIVFAITFVTSIDFARYEDSMRGLLTRRSVNEVNAPTDDLAASGWIRENSALSDVIATNRFLCPATLTCQNDDPNSASSHIISAVSQRRLLLEGPRFLVATPFVTANDYPKWVEDRVSSARAFIDNPNAQSASDLRGLGATWVYVQKKATDVRNWLPWASVKFENESVVILRMSGS